MSLAFDERDRRSVLQDLASDDAEVRRLAVERVVAFPSEQAVGLLVERLGDASWRVRKAAVDRLVALPDVDASAQALLGALADGDNPGRRNAAVEALVRCGSRVVPHLVAALESPDADVRKLLIDTLACSGDERAEAPLVAAVADADPNVRAAAADALGALGGAAALAVLLDLARRGAEDRLVRLAALRALAVLDASMPPAELIPLLDDAILRPAALDVLGRSEEAATPVLLKWLACDSRASRMAAARSLLRVLARSDGAEAEALVDAIREAAPTSAVVEDAIASLAGSDLPTQLVAVQFLGLVRAPRAVVPILLAARDEALTELCLSTLEELGPVAERALDEAWPRLDPPARRDACALLARTRGEVGARRLLATLEESSPEVRAGAARAIAQRRLPDALPALLRGLERLPEADEIEAEEESAALTDALVALAEARPAATLERLVERLPGAPEAVRLAVAAVLGRAGRAQDTDAVALLLKDPSARVRRAAVDALARLDPGTAAEPLRLALADESAAVRIAAACALGASASDTVIDDLERLADDRDPRVRAAAVRAVGRRLLASRDPAVRARGLARLDGALGDGCLVALAGVEALREIGGPAARAAERLLARPEPELVKEAVACLAAHGDANALAAVVPLLAHADWSVRAEAIAALSERRSVRAVPAILRRLETEQDEFVRAEILRALERLEG